MEMAQQHAPSGEQMLFYRREAACFNEALPLGNGRMGAMVYGGVSEEKLSLNEDTLWSGYPQPKREDDYPACYARAQQLWKAGKCMDAQRLLEAGFGDHLVQVYLPAADLIIRAQHVDAQCYQRSLRLDRALHRVCFDDGGKRYQREAFVSAPYQVLALRFSCSEKRSIRFSVSLRGYFPAEITESPEEQALLLSGRAPIYRADFGSAYQGEAQRILDGQGIGYAVAVKAAVSGGRVKTENAVLTVEDADEATLYLSIRTNYRRFDSMPDGEIPIQECLCDIHRAQAIPYEALRAESVSAHQRLYDQCSVSFGPGKEPPEATDIRLKHLQAGGQDNGLYALLFNFAKYLTISASRSGTQPMNLQGIWNDQVLPPWSSNYTLNINTQMNYWPTLAMGLTECFEPLTRFAEELSLTGAQTARRYYGVERGWVCHHSSDVWRLSHPGTNRLPGNAQWGFWNMASGWLSMMLWNAYRYTLDTDYLRRIYPVIEGAACFYRALLTETEDGWVLPLSTSPENNYFLSEAGGETCALDYSTAMTQEILYDLFSAVSQANRILNIPDDYALLAEKLKRPGIQSDGQLCEWDREHPSWDKHHRHASHLYGLYPSDQFLKDEKYRAACRQTLLFRGDGGTGWSLAWKINLWARLGDGEHALRLLNRQLSPVPPQEENHDAGGGTYPNLFCAHPPFQIDGNFGAANGILQMLIQCDQQGEIRLLPALPRAWQTGKVENLRLPGNRTISFAWENGKLLYSRVSCGETGQGK